MAENKISGRRDNHGHQPSLGRNFSWKICCPLQKYISVYGYPEAHYAIKSTYVRNSDFFSVDLK